MKKKDKVKLNDLTHKQVMENIFPEIYIVEMKERPNGDCDVTFDTNKAFDDLYKKKKGRKRATKKGIGNYILEIFQKAINKEDGYDFKPLKDMSK
jgi:hypothetical protein